MMIKGHPCKVLNISVSKTGKHGHAKCNFTATDIFTGKKYEDSMPTAANALVPEITRTEYEVADIDEDDFPSLILPDGNLKTDLKLPIGDE